MEKLKLIYLLVLNFVFFQIISAQTENQRQAITQNYNVEKLKNMSLNFTTAYNIEREKALKYALKNNIEVIIKKENGGVYVLQKILDDGTPLYMTTFNAGSAVTVNTHEVYEGGANGLSLSGKDILFGIWDGGLVRLSHQEFNGRVTQLDDAEDLSSHATHVSGTLIASGVDPEAKGMSFEGSLIAYDFNDNLSEMANEASNGLLISNHSYGLAPSSIPESWFGAYLSFAANIDDIVYNAQNYLPVFAVGNSNNNLPPYNPSQNGYDLISGYNLAKNILSVANVKEVENYVDASSVEIWDSSSWGPTDDGRIKPDISAKGRQTYSSDSDDDDDYSFKTGTSMAAPAVAGSIGLLHEHYNNLYNGFLTAASMRALVIHTAREAGEHRGPDYKHGWGLMNTAAAADVITSRNYTSLIEENTLNEGETYTIAVNAINPDTPLIATLVWSDPAGSIQDISEPNDATPKLVNDLDIKITSPDGVTEFLPWTLSVEAPEEPALTGDNIVDNVEKIEIENAVGQYTIEISHKGSLQDLLQNYSLIVSGIAETDFAITTDEAYKSFCSNDVAIFDLDIDSLDSFSDLITLSQSGLPSSFDFSFSNETINSNGSSTLTVDNLSSQPSGDYPFTITASTDSQSYDFQFSLNTRQVIALDDIVMISPDENSTELLGLSPMLEWDMDEDALFYEIELSTTSNFENIEFVEQTTSNTISLPELNENQTYYFRVKSINDCSVSNFTSGSFTTKSIQCEPLFVSTDTPVLIDDSSTNTVSSEVFVPESLSEYSIEDINVTVNISHTSISDLIITLTSPEGTTITLLDRVCDDLEDMDVIFDDKGFSQACNSSAPTLSGLTIPEDKLSAFYGESFNGSWLLNVEDVTFQDGGAIGTFGIEFCREETLSTSTNRMTDFSFFPNPSRGKVEIKYGLPTINDSKITVFDINGKVLKTFDVKKGSLNKTLDLGDLQSGIYFLQISSEISKHAKKLIIR